MRAEDVGMKSNKLVLGKHSGRHALKDRVQTLGYELSDEKLQDLYDRFIALADKKKEVYDEDIVLLLDSNGTNQAFALKEAQVISGTTDTPKATIILETTEGEKQATSVGDGPINAAFAAINDIIDIENKLIEFSVKCCYSRNRCTGYSSNSN